MTDIVERLRAMNEDGVNHVLEAADVIKELRKILAASQAREKVLRDALTELRLSLDPNDWLGNRTMHGWIDDKLAQPTDDTALKAALAAERERCAKYVPDNMSWIADEIRALGDLS